MDWSVYACLVISSGDVSNNNYYGSYVTNSHGRPPDIGNDYVEWYAGEEGYVFSDVWVFTEDSYGNKNS